MTMRLIRAWLILTNGGDELRVVKRRPAKLAVNEVAIEVCVRAPQPPRVVGTIDIELPEPPPVVVESTTVEYPSDDDDELSGHELV